MPATPSPRLTYSSPALITGLCFLLNFNDGIDIFLLSYSAPEIIGELSLSKTQMGSIFSTGLAGISLGSLLIAPLSDRHGRKKILLAALCLCSAGMAGVALTGTYASLLVFRFLTGLGIGAILPTIATLTAEHSPDRHRDFNVGFVQAGWPVGAIITGLVCARVIPEQGWRFAFGLAAIFCLSLLVLITLFLRQTIPPSSSAISHSPPPTDESATSPSTIRLALAAFFGFLTLYTVMSWVPDMAKEAGLPFAWTAYVGMALNLGAAIGSSAIGAIGSRLGLQKTQFTYLLIAFALMQLYAFIPLASDWIMGMIFLLGIFVQGGFNGIFPLMTRVFPPGHGARQIGRVIGVGRIGAIIGPSLFGLLADLHLSQGLIFVLFSLPLLIMGLLILSLKFEKRKDL